MSALSAAAPGSRADRIRKTFVMEVLAGKEAEYQKSHDEIWPEMASMLKDHGVHNYSISLLPSTRQLFAYVEIEDEARWDAIASTEVCRRWWAAMVPLMVTQEGRPVATELKEVFFLP